MPIRDEQPGDEATIAAIVTAAFATVPHAGGNEARIVDALRAAGALTVSLVATDEGGDPVGHVAFSPLEIEGQPGLWFTLGPVAVLPSAQRRGIGRALIEAGLERLAAIPADGCVLLGDPAYYSRFGFVAGDALTWGGEPSPYLQQKPLAGMPAKGAVTFHPAFDVP